MTQQSSKNLQIRAEITAIGRVFDEFGRKSGSNAFTLALQKHIQAIDQIASDDAPAAALAEPFIPTWWVADHRDSECWEGPHKSMLEATEAGHANFDTDFCVATATQQPWAYKCFRRLDEAFNDENEELGDQDGESPASQAGIMTAKGGVHPELETLLEGVLKQWVKTHGKTAAWALIFHDYHEIARKAG